MTMPRMPSHMQQAGQAVMEYAVFIGVVVAALVAMQLYVRRGIQANLKTLEDQINAEAVQGPATNPTNPTPPITPTPPPGTPPK